MGKSFCEVPDCLRPGEVVLNFGAPINQPTEHAIICKYHAEAAQDYFRESIGEILPIEIHERPRVALDRTGRPYRYPKRKVHDNTERDW